MWETTSVAMPSVALPRVIAESPRRRQRYTWCPWHGLTTLYGAGKESGLPKLTSITTTSTTRSPYRKSARHAHQPCRRHQGRSEPGAGDWPHFCTVDPATTRVRLPLASLLMSTRRTKRSWTHRTDSRSPHHDDVAAVIPLLLTQFPFSRSSTGGVNSSTDGSIAAPRWSTALPTGQLENPSTITCRPSCRCLMPSTRWRAR